MEAHCVAAGDRRKESIGDAMYKGANTKHLRKAYCKLKVLLVIKTRTTESKLVARYTLCSSTLHITTACCYYSTLLRAHVLSAVLEESTSSNECSAKLALQFRLLCAQVRCAEQHASVVRPLLQAVLELLQRLHAKAEHLQVGALDCLQHKAQGYRQRSAAVAVHNKAFCYDATNQASCEGELALWIAVHEWELLHQATDPVQRK
jgi:hypothetical protein